MNTIEIIQRELYELIAKEDYITQLGLKGLIDNLAEEWLPEREKLENIALVIQAVKHKAELYESLDDDIKEKIQRMRKIGEE